MSLSSNSMRCMCGWNILDLKKIENQQKSGSPSAHARFIFKRLYFWIKWVKRFGSKIFESHELNHSAHRAQWAGPAKNVKMFAEKKNFTSSWQWECIESKLHGYRFVQYKLTRQNIDICTGNMGKKFWFCSVIWGKCYGVIYGWQADFRNLTRRT
jgi:hypothetical protein